MIMKFTDIISISLVLILMFFMITLAFSETVYSGHDALCWANQYLSSDCSNAKLLPFTMTDISVAKEEAKSDKNIDNSQVIVNNYTIKKQQVKQPEVKVYGEMAQVDDFPNSFVKDYNPKNFHQHQKR